MTTREHITPINWTRVATVLGVLGAFWLLVTAAAGILDNRYAMRSDLHRMEAKLDRVLDVACDGRQQTVRACQ